MHFSLADLAADIAQNSAESGASLVSLEIQEAGEFRFIAGDNGKGMSGAQLDRAMDPFVTDGVKHPGRKVGLGLPFLIQTALQSGGGWKISSATADGERTVRSGGAAAGNGVAPRGDVAAGNGAVAGGDVVAGSGIEAAGGTSGGSGTIVEAWFDLANVDTPPIGDIPGLFRTVLLFSGPEEIVLKRKRFSGQAQLGGHAGDVDYEIKKTELAEALGGDLEELSALVLLGKYLRSLEGDEDNE